jgi:DNA repair protein RecO (recombination protein O)
MPAFKTPHLYPLPFEGERRDERKWFTVHRGIPGNTLEFVRLFNYSKPIHLPTCGRFQRMETTAAILLRKRKFSDTSLIVSWCTESLGCVQTVAKGARRPKSPFAGKVDLFFEAEISIARSRKSDLHTLTEVVLKNPFAGIRRNYLRMQTAAYFVELIEICTERDHREPELFMLLQRAFGYLDTNDPTPRAVSHFETELARIAGVHDEKKLKADPAFALGNLFGRLPLSRTPLLKTLATEAKNKTEENSK